MTKVSGDFVLRLFRTGDFGRLSVISDGDFGRCAVKLDGDYGRCVVNSNAAVNSDGDFGRFYMTILVLISLKTVLTYPIFT